MMGLLPLRPLTVVIYMDSACFVVVAMYLEVKEGKKLSELQGFNIKNASFDVSCDQM